MKKALVCIFAVLMLVLSGCCMKHEYKDATCTEPKTCTKCGKTEGEPLGHTWIEATCTEPKTCSVCGATEGDPLGHDPAEWEVESVDYVAAEQEMSQKCKTCGEVIDNKTEELTSFIDGDHFTFTGEEFAERFENIYDDVYKDDVTLRFKLEANDYGSLVLCMYNKNDNLLAGIGFYDENDANIPAGEENNRGIYALRIVTPVDEDNLAAYFSFFGYLADTMSMTVDPSIKDSMYIDPISNNTYSTGEGNNLNGLTYSCGYDEESLLLLCDIEIA